MSELLVTTAFLAGVLGSTHCLGMCGGIAALGCAGGPAGSLRWLPVLYNLGRIGSYATAGAMAGAAGAAGGALLPGTRASECARLAAGLAIVLIGLNMASAAAGRASWLRAAERLGGALWRKASRPLQLRLPRRPAPRALMLGLLWGWLPCGLVYTALLAAAAAGGAARGGATMMAFGFGTLPTMAALGYLGGRLSRPGARAKRLVGATVVAAGVWTSAVPLAALLGFADHSAHHDAMATAAAPYVAHQGTPRR